MYEKYGLIRFDFMQGEYSVELTRLISAPEGKTLDEAAHEYMINYYGEDMTTYHDDFGYYIVGNGDVSMIPVETRELTEKEHLMLREYIR